MADALYAEGWTVCVLDLVSEEECQDQLVVFDVPLLAERLADAIPLVRSRRRGGSPPLVIAASGNAAAAAFWLAAESHSVAALISMSGRPHLAEPRLGRVTCPTLLLAPQGDDRLVHLNRMASRRLGRQSQFIALSRKPKGGRSHEGAFTECSLDWLRQALPALWEKPKRPSRPLLEWGQGALSSRLFKSLSGMILAFLSGHHPRW